MTITRTQKDGTTVYTFNDTDELRMRAVLYQQKRGLSMTPAAIRARMKTIQRQQDRLSQEGATGAYGLDFPF